VNNRVNSSGLIGVLLAMLWLPGAVAQTGAEPAFAQADLDRMIENSDPAAKVQLLTPPRQVHFEAVIGRLPKPRKTQYLLDSLEVMGVNPLPEVTQGMDVLSLKNKPLNVYMEKTVAESASKELQTGDRVTLFGYHVFDSQKHGPGILVSGFEAHSLIDVWQEQLGKWLRDR
jgi:hypothetical protein